MQILANKKIFLKNQNFLFLLFIKKETIIMLKALNLLLLIFCIPISVF